MDKAATVAVSFADDGDTLIAANRQQNDASADACSPDRGSMVVFDNAPALLGILGPSFSEKEAHFRQSTSSAGGEMFPTTITIVTPSPWRYAGCDVLGLLTSAQQRPSPWPTTLLTYIRRFWLLRSRALDIAVPIQMPSRHWGPPRPSLPVWPIRDLYRTPMP